MTAAEINKFIEIVGPDADYWLFGDNAINFYNDHRNGHIFVDSANELIHYFTNLGNTLPETYYDESGKKTTKSTEYICTHTDMIQYCRVKLSPEEVMKVTDNLVAAGFITSAQKDEVMTDVVVLGRRGEHSTIASEEIVEVKKS